MTDNIIERKTLSESELRKVSNCLRCGADLGKLEYPLYLRSHAVYCKYCRRIKKRHGALKATYTRLALREKIFAEGKCYAENCAPIKEAKLREARRSKRERELRKKFRGKF